MQTQTKKKPREPCASSGHRLLHLRVQRLVQLRHGSRLDVRARCLQPGLQEAVLANHRLEELHGHDLDDDRRLRRRRVAAHVVSRQQPRRAERLPGSTSAHRHGRGRLVVLRRGHQRHLHLAAFEHVEGVRRVALPEDGLAWREADDAQILVRRRSDDVANSLVRSHLRRPLHREVQLRPLPQDLAKARHAHRPQHAARGDAAHRQVARLPRLQHRRLPKVVAWAERRDHARLAVAPDHSLARRPPLLCARIELRVVLALELPLGHKVDLLGRVPLLEDCLTVRHLQRRHLLDE
mmetsp:Transcript_32819/g.105200  ORF Transcript_32819/g.105200 Transcript_32819/m.105200 type:complete len:294 (-) Transcript_32819:868-1749(-)